MMNHTLQMKNKSLHRELQDHDSNDEVLEVKSGVKLGINYATRKASLRRAA